MDIRLAIPDGTSLVEVYADLEPTDGEVHPAIRLAYSRCKRAGMIPGSYAFLVNDGSVRWVEWDEDRESPIDLDALWRSASDGTEPVEEMTTIHVSEVTRLRAIEVAAREVVRVRFDSEDPIDRAGSWPEENLRAALNNRSDK